MHVIYISLNDIKTSVVITDEHWLALIDLCERENTTPTEIVTRLAASGDAAKLENRLQSYLTNYFSAASQATNGFSEERAEFSHPLEKALNAVAKKET